MVAVIYLVAAGVRIVHRGIDCFLGNIAVVSVDLFVDVNCVGRALQALRHEAGIRFVFSRGDVYDRCVEPDHHFGGLGFKIGCGFLRLAVPLEKRTAAEMKQHG